ncbi:MAG: NAD regulator [Alphaproteobacteria bacterium]|nr:NAD regulator [Alphaproteobacteria bacterium]
MTATSFGPESGADVGNAVVIGLNAAIVAAWDEEPHVLVVTHGTGPVTRPEGDGLPFGPFEPLTHRTLESGLRGWVGEQTALDLGYVEQLYTFGDRGRHEVRPGEGPRVVSVGYLALTRALESSAPMPGTSWRRWYQYFPWEDWRDERPAIIDDVIVPRLRTFAELASDARLRERRLDRVRLTFGLDGTAWDEEKVLERYELLYEACLVSEAERDGRHPLRGLTRPLSPLGQGMIFDHRRILATAMGRLRGKLKYRPVIFELMPPTFTLLELQRTVEGISGIRLHKQNFRRLVEAQGLVEGTGRQVSAGKGRPAEQFRFRREVLRERPAPGVKVPARRRRAPS